MAKEIFKELIGRQVLVRSYDAGVYYGTLVDADENTAKLENVRNIWRWSGANCLADIANHGIRNGGDTRISLPVSSMVINRVCQLMPLTDAAINNLNTYESWTC